jgi:tRNA A-37 threonylcarbamoyl transferase component Bud32
MRDRVSRDFEATRRVHQALVGIEGLGAVRPIACIPDDLVIVTEEVPGATLSDLLELRGAWRPAQPAIRELAGVLHHVGAWLRAFQGIESPGRRVLLGDMRAYLDVRLRRLVDSPRGALDEAERQRLLGYFDATAQDVAAADLEEVGVHADLAPSNVLVNGTTVTIIDFAMAATGGRYLDVARLYTQLDFLTAKPKFRPRVVKALQQALLDGFEPGLTSDRPFFRLFLLQHVICHVANLSLNPSPALARLYNLHQLRRHHAWLQRLEP